MDFVCYSDWAELPASANSLFEQASRESIFFSRPWFENLSNTLPGENQAMLLACVVENDQVLAIIPFIKTSDGQLAPLTHLYSSLYTALLVEDIQDKAIQCLVKGLSQLPTDTFQFSPVAENDTNLQELQPFMQASGFECHQNFRFYNWTHHVNGQSFQAYMSERPARIRNTIGRKQRKLQREHGYQIRLFIDQNIDQALEDFRLVYQSSWKARELYDAFIKGLAHTLARAGWLRLAILYIDKKPAAAQFWFVVHKNASIFKLAYDEAWKQYSPGSILIHYLMEYVIEVDKVKEIDFLTGNDKYKQDWMTERRQRIAVFCGKPKQPRGRTEIKTGIKTWIKIGKFFDFLRNRF
jgi:hypothetical protein